MPAKAFMEESLATARRLSAIYKYPSALSRRRVSGSP
jgi:hypothetical protein